MARRHPSKVGPDVDDLISAQLAHHPSARTITTTSSANHEYVRGFAPTGYAALVRDGPWPQKYLSGADIRGLIKACPRYRQTAAAKHNALRLFPGAVLGLNMLEFPSRMAPKTLGHPKSY
jgi:hypothetical protein